MAVTGRLLFEVRAPVAFHGRVETSGVSPSLTPDRAPPTSAPRLVPNRLPHHDADRPHNHPRVTAPNHHRTRQLASRRASSGTGHPSPGCPDPAHQDESAPRPRSTQPKPVVDPNRLEPPAHPNPRPASPPDPEQSGTLPVPHHNRKDNGNHAQPPNRHREKTKTQPPPPRTTITTKQPTPQDYGSCAPDNIARHTPLARPL